MRACNPLPGGRFLAPARTIIYGTSARRGSGQEGHALVVKLDEQLHGFARRTAVHPPLPDPPRTTRARLGRGTLALPRSPPAPASTTKAKSQCQLAKHKSSQASTTKAARTMPIAGEYSWKETSTHCHVRVLLRGANPKAVDVYASDTYVKISYAPRLIELDLVQEIDDDGVKARVKDNALTLTLPKKTTGLWGALVIEKGSLSKPEVLKRRADARDRRTKKEQALAERAKDRKQEMDRDALRKQMALDETERTTVDDRKDSEKKLAEEDMYAKFREVQIKEAQLKDEADREKRRREKEKLKQAAATGVHEVTESGFDLDDMMANDDIEEEDEENVPPPPPQIPTVRPTKRVVNVNHTPRVFPTPMRESKLKEENAWVQKHRQHLHKNKMLFGQNLVGKDGRTIEEADPTWLKSRADKFFASGDIMSAASAYGAALELDADHAACRANRAACYLKLNKFEECERDCDLGLKLSDASDALKVKFACDGRRLDAAPASIPKRPRTSGRLRRSPTATRTTRNACSPTRCARTSWPKRRGSNYKATPCCRPATPRAPLTPTAKPWGTSRRLCPRSQIEPQPA